MVWTTRNVATLLVVALATLQQAHGQCVQRTFNHESFVCVCNDTYCDEPGLVQLPAPGEYVAYTSDRDVNRLAVSTGAIETQAGTGSVVTVDTSAQYQSMMGFGGAFTDSTGFNLVKLPQAAQDNIIRAYFAPEGIGYSVCRVPIAGSDCSTRPYSYDDVEGDVDLVNFALEPEDYDYKLPYMRQAISLSERELWVFGSPWAPPAWMKTNGMFNETGSLLPEMYQPWANYFVKFVEAYEAEGVPIWGLTPQNEPQTGLFTEPWGWNTCGWTAEDMRDFIRDNLGPTLEAAGMSRLVLMVNDFNRDWLPRYVEPMLADPAAAQYIAGTAVHWYSDRGVGPDVLQQTHDLDPSKFLMYTEACEGFDVTGDLSVQLGSWARGEEYLDNIIEDINYWSTGWVDWNMALGTDGGPNWANNYLDAPIIIDETTGEFYKQPTFYAMAHVSKFIERGGLRVGVTTDNPDVRACAVLNPDGTLVLVVLSVADAALDVSLAVDATSYINVNLPAKSFQTYLLPPQ